MIIESKYWDLHALHNIETGTVIIYVIHCWNINYAAAVNGVVQCFLHHCCFHQCNIDQFIHVVLINYTQTIMMKAVCESLSTVFILSITPTAHLIGREQMKPSGLYPLFLGYELSLPLGDIKKTKSDVCLWLLCWKQTSAHCSFSDMHVGRTSSWYTVEYKGWRDKVADLGKHCKNWRQMWCFALFLKLPFCQSEHIHLDLVLGLLFTKTT